MTFRKLQKSDIAAIRPYFHTSSRVCTRAVGVLYMWAKPSDTEIAFYEGGVVIKNTFGGTEYFVPPQGENAAKGFRLIEEYVRQTGGALRFCSIDDEDLKRLFLRYPAIEIESHRDYADYLYLTSDLADYKGKKYHGQKNHRNKFFREYPQYEFLSFGEEDLPLIYDFLERHKALAPRSREELIEYDACFKLLGAMDSLDLLAAMIRVDGEIAAITVGEILNDTLIIHIEKALPFYEGVYPTICSLFAQKYADKATYINREDDAGDVGLRTSKLQYHPIELIDKRNALCSFSRPLPIGTIFTDRLVIDEFTPADLSAYAALATDDDRNRYWGYDYRLDLGTDPPDAEHFGREIREDAARGVCYSRKIADLSGRFLGEAVLYRFRADGSAELGLRIVRDAAGNGYGREAYRAVADAALISLPKLHARCYKSNEPSRKMILAAGFSSVGEDEEMLYFVREK